MAGGASPASPSRGSALLSGISSAVAGAIRLLSPPRITPPSELIGASPFVESLVDSTVSTSDESITDKFGGGQIALTIAGGGGGMGRRDDIIVRLVIVVVNGGVGVIGAIQGGGV